MGGNRLFDEHDAGVVPRVNPAAMHFFYFSLEEFTVAKAKKKAAKKAAKKAPAKKAAKKAAKKK